jgi:Putative MetA-pathway of phenol degradation
MKLNCVSCTGVVLLTLLIAGANPAHARIIKSKKPAKTARELVVGSRLEFESSDRDLPLLVEWSPSRRLQLTAEWAYAQVQLDNGSNARGFKDLELSAVYGILPQRRRRPGLALELDLKAPTTNNRQLGTGKPDVGIGFVANKDLVRWDLELSGLYTFVGSPSGQRLANVYELSLAAERHISPRIDVFGELVGSGGGAIGGSSKNGFGLGGLQTASFESGGTEGEFTFGVAEHLTRHFKLEQGATYKSDGTVLAIVGWEYNFGFGE